MNTFKGYHFAGLTIFDPPDLAGVILASRREPKAPCRKTQGENEMAVSQHYRWLFLPVEPPKPDRIIIATGYQELSIGTKPNGSHVVAVGIDD